MYATAQVVQETSMAHLPESTRLRGSMGTETLQEAIVYGHFVIVSLYKDGHAVLDCLDLETWEIVKPPEKVLILVSGWLGSPFFAGLDLQDWFIKTIEDENVTVQLDAAT